MLAEFESIDYLVTFDDDTPLSLIEPVGPDVLVKGADYAKEQVVGWDLVEARGGRVALAPLVEGRSTSTVIDKIIKAYGCSRSAETNCSLQPMYGRVRCTRCPTPRRGRTARGCRVGR